MSSKVFKTLKISVKIFLLLNFLHDFNTKLNVSRPRNDLAYDKLSENKNIKSDSKTSKVKKNKTMFKRLSYVKNSRKFPSWKRVYFLNSTSFLVSLLGSVNFLDLNLAGQKN